MSYKESLLEKDFQMNELQKEVAGRFGVLPNFFKLSPQTPEITESLWGFASFAYVDNPLPSLFKERLFVYLSRFCDVRYCIIRHIGFLVGLGFPSGDSNAPLEPVERVLQLLRRPLPRFEQINFNINQLNENAPISMNCILWRDEIEEVVFACATHVFLQTESAPRCLEVLKKVFNSSDFQYLLVFLAFIRTAHYWSKVQTELDIEEDVERLLNNCAELEEAIQNDPEAKFCEIGQELLKELNQLRQEKKYLEGQLYKYERLHEKNQQELRVTQTNLLERMVDLDTLSDEVEIAYSKTASMAEANEKLRQSEARLANELADSQLLQQVSSKLIEEEHVERLYDQIIETAKEIMHSDYASMHLYVPETKDLKLLAWSGFPSEYIELWDRVNKEQKNTCGTALKMGKRIFVSDIERCAFMQGTPELEAYRLSGICSAHSTPLISRTGILVGIISNHWKKNYIPSERKFGLLDIVTRQAADLLERKQAEEALRESEKKLRLSVLLRDEFISNASHELNTPLTSMMIYGHILEQHFKEFRVPSYLEMIQKLNLQLNRLQMLIRDMLDTTRIR